MDSFSFYAWIWITHLVASNMRGTAFAFEPPRCINRQFSKKKRRLLRATGFSDLLSARGPRAVVMTLTGVPAGRMEPGARAGEASTKTGSFSEILWP